MPPKSASPSNKAPATTRPPSSSAPAAARSAPPPVPPPGPLFRRQDWLAFLISTGITLLVYLWSVAPDVTLEDSGELAVASFYAGVPHPPGYPVWTLYTWLFTVILPFSNIAWRVGVSSAVAAALSSGFLALMVSRVSSHLVDSLDTGKQLTARVHQAICIVAGVTGGLLIGFNGFMWSQAVIVEVYTFSVLSLVLTLVLLLHYVYAPEQRRYLYAAAFLFGIAFTNHQTLIVAAMGIQVLLALANPKLGRDAFLANSLIYLVAVILMQNDGLDSIRSSDALSRIFHIIGIASIAACAWLAWRTAGLLTEWKAALISLGMWILGASFYLFLPITSATNPPLNWGYPRTWDGFVHAFTRGQYEKTSPSLEFDRIFDQVLMLFEGAVEEFNLVYLLIALVPFLFWARLRRTEKSWMLGLTAIYACLAFLLLWLLNPSPDRQSRELTKVFFTASHVIIAMGIGYGLAIIGTVIATEYLAARKWLMVAGIAAGSIALFLVLVTFGAVELFPPDHPSYFFGIEATRDPVHRFASVLAFGFAIAALALLAFRPHQPHLTGFLVLFALLPVKTALSHWGDNEQRGHLFGYWFGHDMFIPPFQGPDGQPLYPEIPTNTILFGGTDPGRFNPTYMIFCESFIPPRTKPRNPTFDRRDVYLITQNALADGTYLNYIRAHYNKSAQIPLDSPFFQEMLRPQKEREQNYYTNRLSRAVAPLDRALFSFGNAVETRRRAGSSRFERSHFTEITALASRLKDGPQQDAFSRHLASLLSPKTRAAIADDASPRRLGNLLSADLNRLLDEDLKSRLALQEELNLIDATQPDLVQRQTARAERLRQYHTRPEHLFPPELLASLPLSDEVQRLIAQDVPTAARFRTGRRILEEAYAGLITLSPGGVYPELEIHTPTVEESARCYNDYMQDAFQRKQLGQLRNGEDVQEIGGRVTVSGQVAVMAINALLCRVIFDKNPDHEFYIEESFPLEWMYPHLSPHGIIMKINRTPLDTLDEDAVQRDQLFWRQYSQRLIGDWITPETSVKEICDWVEKTFIQRDLRGFQGDRKFMRDDQAQKAFSKLRSSIGGVFAWRINQARSTEEQQRMFAAADFAFRQSFAFCPYSPEAVFRYAQILAQVGRFEDAHLIASTARRLDPFNGSILSLIDELTRMQQSAPQFAAARQNFQRQEERFRTNPADVANAMALAQAYLDNQLFQQATQVFSSVVTSLRPEWQANPTNPTTGAYLAAAHIQLRQPVAAKIVLDKLVDLPGIDPNTLIAAAQTYAQLGDGTRLESTLRRLVEIAPNNAEAWYDYSGVLATLNQGPAAFNALENALRLSDARRAQQPTARDLRSVARTDPRFQALRTLPDWTRLVGRP
jgi:tetratricopeptide (TPR) repeat protein